jgi:hypothetical protein
MLGMVSVSHPAAILFRLVGRLSARPAHDHLSPGVSNKSIDNIAVMIWVTRKEIRYTHYPTAKGCCGTGPSKRARLARSSRADSAHIGECRTEVSKLSSACPDGTNSAEPSGRVRPGHKQHRTALNQRHTSSAATDGGEHFEPPVGTTG